MGFFGNQGAPVVEAIVVVVNRNWNYPQLVVSKIYRLQPFHYHGLLGLT
jgi:hypothetical protein